MTAGFPPRRSPRAGPGALSTRPPRYRLLSAAARLPARPRPEESVTYHLDCPGCGVLVRCTQTHRVDGVRHTIEDHDCRGDTGSP